MNPQINFEIAKIIFVCIYLQSVVQLFTNTCAKKMAYYTYFLSLLITSTIANSLNETVPKTNSCYKNGTYSRGTVIQVSVQTSPETCANHCIAMANCNYFTFDPIKQMCEAISDRYYDEISTSYCPDCVSGRRDEFCGAHGYCKVHTTVPPWAHTFYRF